MDNFLSSVDAVNDAMFLGIKYDPLRTDKRWTVINELKGERITDCNLEDLESILIEYYFSGAIIRKQSKKRLVKKSYSKRRKS